MPYVTIVKYIGNNVISKEKAIEDAVAAAITANPGYDIADVTVAAKPDGSYNVVTTLTI